LSTHNSLGVFRANQGRELSQHLRACDETAIIDPPTTTPTLHSPLQLITHKHRQHVQSYQGPVYAANTHDGYAAYAHGCHAPEPPALHEADDAHAQPCACMKCHISL
jgi:hypothetical protein